MMQNYGDKETISDFIASEKQISASYNTFAHECVCPNLRNDFLNILKDTHEIQAELFTEASNRGWYPIKQAPANEITQLKTKFATAV